MGTLAQSLGQNRKALQWGAFGTAILVVWAVIAIPGLHRSDSALGPIKAHRPEPATRYSASPAKAMDLALSDRAFKIQAVAGEMPMDQYDSGPDAAASRKIVRCSSLEMVVQHPAETAEKIRALAESFGGYLETSNGGGQDATSGTLTIRVPADRFEQARAEIRKLGLRVENEQIQAQDVTSRYVDQDASLRNLRAEEAQYLTILKQATTVKDMMAVSEKLSEVRGEIERQEAEFHALSRQVETVSIAVSLRTQAEERAFGLNWRPLHQIRIAIHDGLESVANYATTMIGILFYLPAVFLWVGTIATAAAVSWRLVRWMGRRWFGWDADQTIAQG